MPRTWGYVRRSRPGGSASCTAPTVPRTGNSFGEDWSFPRGGVPQKGGPLAERLEPELFETSPDGTRIRREARQQLMARRRRLTRAVCAGIGLWLLAATIDATAQNLQYLSGQNVVPVFEGWERNQDGSFAFYFGYLNRNYREELAVPIGPDNRIEPGHLEQTQPTYFYPRRHRFLFTVRVPAGWGDGDVTWTLTSNGKTETAYGSLLPVWEVNGQVISENRAGSGYADGNQPPSIELVGERERTVEVDDTLSLVVRISDDGIPEARAVGGTKDPRVDVDATGRPLFGAGRFGRRNAMGLRVAWIRWSGPGKVTFDPWYMEGIDDHMPGWAPPPLPPDGEVVTSASFSAPGSYVIRAMADDGYFFTPVDVAVTVSDRP